MSVSKTSTKSAKAQRPFDIATFEHNLSEGEVELSLAVDKLRRALYSGDVAGLTELLLRKASLFEYVYSIIDDSMAAIFRDYLMGEILCVDNTDARPSKTVIDRLAKFIYFLPSPSKPPLLAKDLQFVQPSQEILKYLATADFGQQAEDSSDKKDNDGDDDDEFTKFSKRKRSQKQGKKSKLIRKLPPKVDRKPFLYLGEDIPTTNLEAQELESRLLTEQTELLGRSMDLLRDPSLLEIIREQYVPLVQDVQATSSANLQENEAGTFPAAESTAETLTPAYPYVQPLKASLYFDSAEGLGEWRIFMSTTAIADLRSHRKSPKTFDIIIKKMRELSNGFFSDDNQKRLKGPSKSIPIYEAKLTSDLRLIYQIDCMSDYESKFDLQVIRVYGIFTHARMDNRMWESLSAQLATRGKEYHKRVAFRRKPQVAGDNVYRPQSWPAICDTDETSGETSISSLVNAGDLQMIHHWLVLEKYSAFSQTLLDCIRKNKDMSPVFAVSPYERDIIEHPSSCYVLGRSGTGKTTSMAFKIFGVERAVQMHSVELDAKPRQLFVTQSRVLASRVRDYYAKLSEFLSAGSKDSDETLPMSKMVDPVDDLGDPEDDEDWRSDLPARFSELQDSHFPLFLTFDKLCKLIENDLEISFARPVYTKEHKRAERRFNLSDVMKIGDLEMIEDDETTGPFLIEKSSGPSSEAVRSTLVSFDSFRQNYWSHFPQDLTKNLDPALVFSEFMGVIKGSEESLKSKKHYLSREAYLGLSERKQFTFASMRERIYNIFEKYLVLKRQYGDYDAADRSHAIIQRMREGYSFSVDFLYVDEAQDNLLIDAFLLRYLCRNPHGLFWAGDTAQTIAIGSSFRFDELKATLHCFERNLYPSLSENDVVKPAFFQLTTNYRSHDGIVNCADVIIELIVHFWPNSIDTLRKEKGMVDGPKPIFFTGCNDENARYEQFLLGEKGNSVEFGAHQCILVRDDHARNELQKEVGEIGVIMTLYESKGLEFDDVLLYKFFKDSPCELSQWRSVLDFIVDSDGTKKTAPRFDEVRHAGICTELKFLYVAVTRARKNLWIIDKCEKGEKGNPMKTLLLHRARVVTCTPENAPKLAEASTSDEWAKTGSLLFSNKRYPQAIHCFERAGLHHERSIANAYYLRHLARNVPRSKSDEARKKAFVTAAHAFFSCAQSISSTQKNKYFHIAAECFGEAQANVLAAQSYQHAEDFTNAATYFRKADMFDDAVEVILSNRELVDSSVADSIIDVSRLHYVHVGKPEKVVKLFECEEDCLEFLDDCGFDTARATILESLGRILEAAELYFNEGRSKKAIHLLLNDATNPASLSRAAEYTLSALWKHYSFGNGVEQMGAQSKELLAAARKIDSKFLVPEVSQELEIFDTINEKDVDVLMDAYRAASTVRSLPATIMMLDHILRSDRYTISDMQRAMHFLQACLSYANTLRGIWISPNPMESPDLQKLFGVRQISKDVFLVPEHSALAVHAAGTDASFSFRNGEAELNQHAIMRVIKDFIIQRLRNMVQAEVIRCGNARNKLFGDPCLMYATQGQCNRGDCFRQHIVLKEISATWFSMRVRINLLQILFLQTADFALADYPDRLRYQRDWLTNLFNVLNPSHSTLGSMASISQDHIPEFHEGMSAVASWIESRFYHISPNFCKAKWFLYTITEIVTLGFYQDKLMTWNRIYRAPFYTGEGIIRALKSELGYLRIPDLIRSLDTLGAEFIESGCKFIQNVIQHRLSIDANHVCHLIETLCGAGALVYKKLTHSFHGCLLPRTWLVDLLPKLLRNQETQAAPWPSADLLIKHSSELARHLLVGTDDDISHLRGTRAYIVRAVSIQRICRAICLLGYNTNHRLRGSIVDIMLVLRRATTTPVHSLLRPFLLSTSWAGLRRAAESSIIPSALEEMVQLVQENQRPVTIFSAAKINRVTFSNDSDLLSIFSSMSGSHSFQLSATATAFIPKSETLSVLPAVAGADQVAMANLDDNLFVTDDIEDDEDQVEDPMDMISDGPQDVSDNNQSLAKAPTIEENAARVILRSLRRLRNRRREKAAITLQRRYRSICAYRDKLNDPGILGKRARFHRDCKAFSLLRKWPSRPHKKIYLDLVPHLLVCLDTIKAQIVSDKAKAKKQIGLKPKGSKVDYEEVILRLNRSIKNRKRLDRLRKLIDIESEWHVERTSTDLQNMVLDISAFITEVKATGAEFDISQAMKAIVQKPNLVPSKKEDKPELNVDDLDDFY